jgi:hypothetical protein
MALYMNITNTSNFFKTWHFCILKQHDSSSESEKNIEDFKRMNTLLISLKMLMPVFTVRISSLNEPIVSSIAE